jgi:hypothetical protein
MVNFRRHFVSFKRFTPVDIGVFIGLNVICGIYIWKPFLKDMENNKKPIEVEESLSTNDGSIKDSKN